MPIYNANSAEVLIYTFKEGLLSAVAHDLKLRVTAFHIEIDEANQTIAATFDPSSLRVVCARKDGRDAPDALPSTRLAEIEKNICDDVLRPTKFPELRFASTSVTDDSIAGSLTLHGVTRPVRVSRSHEGAFWVARTAIDQRHFGIKPYSAALGTLKVKAETASSLSCRASW